MSMRANPVYSTRAKSKRMECTCGQLMPWHFVHLASQLAAVQFCNSGVSISSAFLSTTQDTSHSVKKGPPLSERDTMVAGTTEPGKNFFASSQMSRVAAMHIRVNGVVSWGACFSNGTLGDVYPV
jgi:hypothetical protein